MVRSLARATLVSLATVLAAQTTTSAHSTRIRVPQSQRRVATTLVLSSAHVTPAGPAVV